MAKLKMKRFPGDTIVVPMLIGVVLNSFIPQVLQIGGFFTGMVNGTSALVGVFLLFMGATIDVRSTPKAIKIGGVIIATKVAMAVILGLGVAFFFDDNFLGLSSLAIISAVSVANNALYSGIVSQYDDDAVKGAVAITSLSVGPTVTMIALSSAGLASISIGSIVGSILPLIIGIILGNVSPWFKQTLSAGVTPSIIVVGFALGCGMSIQQLFQGGLSGILLGPDHCGGRRRRHHPDGQAHRRQRCGRRGHLLHRRQRCVQPRRAGCRRPELRCRRPDRHRTGGGLGAGYLLPHPRDRELCRQAGE